jgi:hypothetical protein
MSALKTCITATMTPAVAPEFSFLDLPPLSSSPDPSPPLPSPELILELVDPAIVGPAVVELMRYVTVGLVKRKVFTRAELTAD